MIELSDLATLSPMVIVNMHAAKTQLSKLVERALAGEEIVVAKAGKPLVKLVPVAEKPAKRRLGLWEGKIWLADGWDSDELNEEIARDFYEGEIFPPQDE